MRYLRAPQWPLTTLLPWWKGDYTDIRDRLHAHGYLDIAESGIWTRKPDESECDRHSAQAWKYDAEKLAEVRRRGTPTTLAERERARAAEAELERQRAEQAAADRAAAEAALAAAEAALAVLAAAAEQRRLAAAALAGKEAEERKQREQAASRLFWSNRNPAYATERFHSVPIATTGKVAGATLEAGKTYYLPESVRDQIVANTKAHR